MNKQIQTNLWNMDKGKTKEVIRYIEAMDHPVWMNDINHKEKVKSWYKKQKYALSQLTANRMLEIMNINLKIKALPYKEFINYKT